MSSPSHMPVVYTSRPPSKCCQDTMQLFWMNRGGRPNSYSSRQISLRVKTTSVSSDPKYVYRNRFNLSTNFLSSIQTQSWHQFEQDRPNLLACRAPYQAASVPQWVHAVHVVVVRIGQSSRADRTLNTIRKESDRFV